VEVTLRNPRVSVSLPIGDRSGAGEARLAVIRLAEELKFAADDIQRLALVVTEAAANIAEHAGRGEILLRAIFGDVPATVEVLALDRGPGIANVAKALRDDFSTSGSAGLGLGKIARTATLFDISSTPGKGTALLARVAASETKWKQEPGLTWGVVCVPKRGEAVCGDAWAVTPGALRNTILVVDGLGHGELAFKAARQALSDFWDQPAGSPAATLEAVHRAMKADHGNRGAVAAVAEIDWQRRELRFCGAGNISGTIVPPAGRASNLVSHSGTLGDNVTRFQEFTHAWPAQGLLVLNSDGLSNAWELSSYPGLSRKHPSLIAAVLYRDFASRKDDVVVLVGRERERIHEGDVR
jgi:anti-sigma regulatory factor (Ser/Thr protein kinase)